MLPSGTDQVLREAFRRCQSRFPAVTLLWESFCGRVEEVVAGAHREHTGLRTARSAGGEPNECSDCAALVGQLHHEDLFLALACAGGDRIGWEQFIEQYFALVRRFAVHACHGSEAGEDLAQEILVDLFGASSPTSSHSERGASGSDAGDQPAGSAPQGKLRSYNGRGSLAGWLRASVSHAAIDGFRRARRQVSLDELLEHGTFPEPRSPASLCTGEERLDARWGPKLAQEVADEIARLGARDRLLLSLYHFQGVSLKAIGRRFGVHEATASRWLERLRRSVRKRVEQRFQKLYGIGAGDLGSLWRWVSEAEVPEAAEPQKKMQGSTP